MVEEGPPVLPRFITIHVVPGEDVEVDWTGFSHWEAKAALDRAFHVIEDDEDDQYVLGIKEKYGENGDDPPSQEA